VSDGDNYDDMKGGFVTLTRQGETITLSMSELEDEANRIKIVFNKHGVLSVEHKTPENHKITSVFDALLRFMEYP
jgi:hypothetical protein